MVRLRPAKGALMLVRPGCGIWQPPTGAKNDLLACLNRRNPLLRRWLIFLLKHLGNNYCCMFRRYIAYINFMYHAIISLSTLLVNI